MAPKSAVKGQTNKIVSAIEELDIEAGKKQDLQELVCKIDEIYQAGLEAENERLRSRLEELEETFRAIRAGAVDALVISDSEGEKIYTLSGAEHPYRIMVETMGEGAVTLSREGTILYANSSFARLVEKPLEQVIGSPFVPYIRYEDRAEFLAVLQQDTENSQLEISLSTRKKSKIPVYVSIGTMGGDSSFGYFSIVVTDLTHQKNEELLRRSESELKEEIHRRNQIQRNLEHSRNMLFTLVQSAPVGIVMTNVNGRILFSNPHAESIFGEKIKGPREPRGYTFFRLDGSPLAAGELPSAQALKGCRVMDIELLLKSFAGTESVVLAGAVPLKLKSGEVWGVLNIYRDITGRKQAERALQQSKDELEDRVRERTSELSRTSEELRASEEAYRMLVELNPVGVFRVAYDPVTGESKRLHCNEAHLRIFGYDSLSEYLAGHSSEIFSSERERINLREMLWEKGKLINREMEMKRRDGRTVWTLLNAVIRKEKGNVLMEGSVTDIGKQKEVEFQLRSTQKSLRAMVSEVVLAEERARQHYAADLHDTVVQTLGAAKLRSQLIQHQVPRKARQVYSDMQDFISQSITQARSIMAEMSPPVLNEFCFVPALEWLAEEMSRQHGIHISFRSKVRSVSLPREVELLLYQSARELLMNVVKHAQAQSAGLKFSNTDRKVNIEVKDDGRGFDMKRTLQPSLTGGFGLYSIRERLRHIGGQLAIKSVPGEGTTVLVSASREPEDNHSLGSEHH